MLWEENGTIHFRVMRYSNAFKKPRLDIAAPVNGWWHISMVSDNFYHPFKKNPGQMGNLSAHLGINVKKTALSCP